MGGRVIALTLTLLLALVSAAGARMSPVMLCGTPGVSASCSGEYGNGSKGSLGYNIGTYGIEVARIPVCSGGKIANVNVWLLSVNSSSRRVVLVVYADNAGEPGALLWKSAELWSGDWSPATKVSSAPTDLTINADFAWVGFHAESNITARYYENTGGNIRKYLLGSFGAATIPETWNTLGDESATYAPSYSVSY